MERSGEIPQIFDIAAIADVLGRQPGIIEDEGNHTFSLSRDPDSTRSVLVINPERRSVDCTLQKSGVPITWSLDNVLEVDLAGRVVEFRELRQMPSASGIQSSWYDVIRIEKVEEGFAVSRGTFDEPFTPD